MLRLVMAKLDPSMIVGVELLCQRLETIRLAEFSNNVEDMCSTIEATMKKINGLGKECESIRRYVITALKSGPNANFNAYIDRINDDIESGTGQHRNMAWDDICESACSKYRNMESTKEWSKVDP